MKFKNHISISIPLLFLWVAFYAGTPDIKEGEKADNKGVSDTTSAVVLYGCEFLFEHYHDLTAADVEHSIDSLQALVPKPTPLIDQMQLYLRVQKMNDDHIYSLIDSLFETEEVPYALVNQINVFIAMRSEGYEPDIELWFEDSTDIPANALYGSWNTGLPNPYTNKITQEDDSLYLVLQGGEKLGEFQMPVTPYEGKLTSRFGWRHGKNHNGLDIDLQVWDTVVAAFPGKVRVAKWHEGYGRVVVIRHFNGLETTYAHLHRFKVKTGDEVKAGQLIGLGGSSGNSTGSHLHWEVRFKGVPLNPMSFLEYKEGKLVNDTLILKKTKWNYAAYPAGTRFHVVRNGDFLYKIANEYGTTATRICEMNGIRRNSMLYVGQRLRVI